MVFDFLKMGGDTIGSAASPSDSSVMQGASGGSNIPGLQNILNLVGSGMRVGNAFKGYQPTAAEGAQGQVMSNQGQSLSNQGALLQALLDPNSTIYKNIVSGQTQQLNNTTQQGINDLLQQNRKAQLMGRGNFFNPERQDEAVSQYLTKQADTNANTARSNALDQIIKAANGYGSQATGYGNQATGYGNMVKGQQAAQDINKDAASNGLSGIAQMLPGLLKAGATIAPMFL
jgi:hypothetical protein